MQKKAEELFWNLLLGLIGSHPVFAAIVLLGLGAIILWWKWDDWSQGRRWVWTIGIGTTVLTLVYLLYLQAMSLPPIIRVTKINALPYEVGQESRVNIYLHNDSTAAIELSGYSKVFVKPDVATDIKEMRAFEEESWSSFSKEGRPEPGFEMPPMSETFVTLAGDVFTAKEATKLKAGQASLYFMAILWYSDENGNPWRIERCGSYMANRSFHFLCKGHNDSLRGN